MPDARVLRKSMTDAERKLWSLLRDRQLDGHKFRRQHPLGSYVLDFACLEQKLVVEVDGGQHAESERDRQRTAWLEAQGWRVIRFWNNDVLSNPESVSARLTEAMRK
jgi:very-short-patch-repair endonuclease